MEGDAYLSTEENNASFSPNQVTMADLHVGSRGHEECATIGPFPPNKMATEITNACNAQVRKHQVVHRVLIHASSIPVMSFFTQPLSTRIQIKQTLRRNLLRVEPALKSPADGASS